MTMTMTELQTILQAEQNKKICVICSENKGYKWEVLAESIDNYIVSFYPTRVICDIYGSETESIKLLTVACINAMYKSKEWEYNKLYESLFLKYEPLNNYDRNETETIITDSTLSSTIKQGAQTNTTSGNVNIGERNDRNTSTNTNGSRNDTTENTMSVSPSDEKNIFYGKEKNETNASIGEQTATAETSNNIGAQNTTSQNTDNIGERNDSKNDIGNVVIDRNLKVLGNIGTLTSQKMLSDERDVAFFELIKIIAHDTVNAICSGIWEIL